MKRGLITILGLAVGIGFLARAADEGPPPAAEAVPPPSAPAKRSAAELEKLVESIALYPDPLIAAILPASVYPLEIVQAARFMADTNNLAKLDAQPWDENVKAVARVPDALKKLNDDLTWTTQLGEAFLDQDKDLMDAIQSLRLKAQKAGTLQTTEQQVVVVTNVIVETAVQQEVVVVTNTVVQIVPSNPEVIYVPQYVPSAVYYPPPSYVYDPYAPVVTFAAGVAVGAIIAGGCDWHYGGVYVGHHGVAVWGGGYYGGDVKYGDKTKVKIEGDVNIGSGNVGSGNRPSQGPGAGNKWQPDQNRLRSSGGKGMASPSTREARGWGSGSSATTRPSAGTGAAGARPSTGAVGGTRPSTGTPSVSRPSTTPGTPRASTTGSGYSRPSSSASPVSRPSSGSTRTSTGSSSYSRPSSSSSGSAFKSSGSSSSVRSASSRGSTSRSAPARSGGGGRGGGGGRR